MVSRWKRRETPAPLTGAGVQSLPCFCRMYVHIGGELYVHTGGALGNADETAEGEEEAPH